MIIHLELDLTKTRKLFLKYASEYNTLLELDPGYLHSEYEKHCAEGIPDLKETVKSLSIKNGHILTAQAIMEAYYIHLKNMKSTGITVSGFEINSPAMATMTGTSARTIRRHIKKLIAIGFITEKIFQGKNTSYAIKLNPDFLVARPDPELSNLLIKQFTTENPTTPIPLMTIRYYQSISPSFSDFPGGVILTSCPHIEIKQDSKNNNILSGIVENWHKSKNSQHPTKIFVFNNKFKSSSAVGTPDTKQEQTSIGNQSSINQSFTETLRQEKNFAPAVWDEIHKMTEMSWTFASKLLYPKRKFRPEVILIAKRHIAAFYAAYMSQDDKRLKPGGFFMIFTSLVQMIRDHIDRNTDYRIYTPDYFFSPQFRGGFNDALQKWLPNQRIKEAETKEWNTHRKLVSSLFAKFCLNPGYETYHNATQRLGKLKNPKFLNRFLELVDGMLTGTDKNKAA